MVDPMQAVYDAVTAFLSNILAYITSVVTAITGNTALTVFIIGIPLVSFAVGLLSRLIRNVF